MFRSLFVTTGLALILSASPHAALAESSTTSRISALEQELNLLKRQLEVKEEVEKSRASKSASVEYGKKGLSITSPDKNFNFKIRGYSQIDGRFFIDDDAGTGSDQFLARRLRPIIEGVAYKDFSFRLMPDFAGSSTRIFDAHVDYAYSDAAKLRVGKFKPPLGLERLQSATDIFFAERGQPTNLAPSRDYGVQLYGDFLSGALEYQVGLFNGNADLGNSDGDDDDKKDVVARIFTTPFRNADTVALRGLGIGIAGSYGTREGSAGKSILGDYRSPGQQAFFKYRTGTAATTAFADGTHWRLYPQAYYYHNNVGFIAEYALSTQEVTVGAVSDTLQHSAWQVAGSYVLTGEDVNFKGAVSPAKSFDPNNGQWGAFELVARVGQTDIDDDTFPLFASISSSASKATSYGTGINWHLNDNVKFVIDYEHTSFDGGAAGGADRDDENVIFTRVQYRL